MTLIIMKSKTLLYLGLVLVVLLVVMVGRNLLQKQQAQQLNDYQQALARINKNNIAQINFEQDGESLEISKVNGNWQVASRSADPQKVEELLSALFTENNPILIGQSDEQRQNFNLTEAEAVKVKLQNSDGQEVVLWIGRQSGPTTAVSLAGQKQIYELRHLSNIGLDPQPWFDLNIVDLEANEIKKLSFTNFSASQTSDGVWQLEPEIEGEQINHDGLNTFAMKLNPLIASELVEDVIPVEYDVPISHILIIEKSNGKTVTLEFYKGESDYLVTKLPESDNYMLSEFTGDELDKSRDGFVLTEN